MSGSFTGRVAAAWTNPARSWRAEASRGLREGRLLALAFGATLFLTLGRVGAEIALPQIASGEARTAWIAATVFTGFSFGVLALYGVAALTRLVCRLFRGDGGWAESRLALFWSGLAAGPAAAALHIIGALAGFPAVGGGAASLVWAVLFAPMLAAAHGFAAWRVYAAFAVIAAAVTAYISI